MRSFIVAAVSLLSLGAVHASPLQERSASCLTSDTANGVAANFQALIADTFNKTLALHALTKNYTDYSSSVNTLIDSGCTAPLALDDPTFTSRKAFIQGQGSQPPIPFAILNVWWTCDTVIVRWRSDAPGTVTPEEPVTGIVVLETVPNPVKRFKKSYPYMIDTVYSEFNSGAWLYDLGVFVPNCTNSTSTKRSVENRPFFML